MLAGAQAKEYLENSLATVSEDQKDDQVYTQSVTH